MLMILTTGRMYSGRNARRLLGSLAADLLDVTARRVYECIDYHVSHA